MPDSSLAVRPAGSAFWSELARLGLLINLETRVLAILVSYAASCRNDGRCAAPLRASGTSDCLTPTSA
jgi:hypothetical protein